MLAGEKGNLISPRPKRGRKLWAKKGETKCANQSEVLKEGPQESSRWEVLNDAL